MVLENTGGGVDWQEVGEGDHFHLDRFASETSKGNQGEDNWWKYVF